MSSASIPSTAAAAAAAAAPAVAQAKPAKAPKKTAKKDAAPKEAATAVPVSCSICMEDCNKSSKKPAVCAYCDGVVCRGCLQTYLTQDTATEAACPGCRAAWDSDFVASVTTTVFRNGAYKAHREKVLFDREKARFPETMPEAEAYKVAKEMCIPVEARIGELYSSINNIPQITAMHAAENAYYKYSRSTDAKTDPTAYTAKMARLRAEREEAELAWKAAQKPIKKQIGELRSSIVEAKRVKEGYGRDPRTAGAAGAALEEPRFRREFIHKCPAADCEGFLNKEWRCGICNILTCKECHEIVGGAGHDCNPDVIESVKALSKESKPCPKCAAAISKISGCDQMWCTQCQTAFSWRTGAIETVVIHNPHYFEWRRAHGAPPRAPGDIPCGGPDRILDRLDRLLLTEEHAVRADFPVQTYAWKFPNAAAPRHNRRYNLLKFIQEFLRKSSENNRRAARHRQELQALENPEWRRVLRVRRIVGEIRDEELRRSLRLKDNEFIRTRGRMQLAEMYSGAVIDILSEFNEATFNPDDDKLYAICKQLCELLTFTCKANRLLIKRYGAGSNAHNDYRPYGRIWHAFISAFVSKEDLKEVLYDVIDDIEEEKIFAAHQRRSENFLEILKKFRDGGHDILNIVIRNHW